MNRREFLISSAMAAGAAGKAWAQRSTRAKTDRIAIMTHSFENVIKLPGRPDSPTRDLEFFDVPGMFADRYKVHNLEIGSRHFFSTELSYFKDFLSRLAKTGSRVSNISVELADLNISSPDPVLRTQAVDLTKRWIDHAVTLGSPRVMVNQGPLTQESKQAAIETLKLMGAYGKSRRIMVAMEPRGLDPPPSAYVLLTEVIKASGTYSNPDVGNFGGDQDNQHAGMRAMFPLNNGNCHVKLLTPPRYDLSAAITLTKELGYTGLYSIEFPPRSGDPYAGVQAVYDVLIANI